jgi:hypothetical protein
MRISRFEFDAHLKKKLGVNMINVFDSH